ncbi:MAG TPA: hypothetical protein VIG90_06690 [Pedomonas sp.]|uniref:hypothetical protein n=1 Tax=Pedomonas sp. TaxID=2976421 RepID=UPI002F42B8B1
MARLLSADLAKEIEKPVLRPFFAVYIGLDDPVAAWTGIGTLSFGGRDYLGTGALGSIGTVGEGTDGAAVGISVGLSGIDPSFSEDILGQAYRGKPFELYVGALAENWQSVVAPPKRIWKGRVDTVDVTDGDQLAVSITAESRMRDQGRPRIRRLTNAEQQRRYPGDRFFEYLAQMVEVSILWGKKS